MKNDNLISDISQKSYGLRLSLLGRLAPFSAPKISLLDNLEIDLGEASIDQILIPKLENVPIEEDYCFSKPLVLQVNVSVGVPNVADFTSLLQETISLPEIASIFEPLIPSPIKGKVYSVIGKGSPADHTQERLFNDEKCKHGIEEDSCSTCTPKEPRSSKKTATGIDIFDLILPILTPPPNLQTLNEFLPGKELYPYQIQGIEFLANSEAALLADEMGLGKTIQAVVSLLILFHTGKISSALIICPRSVFTSWGRELESWAPGIHVSGIRGSKVLRELKWSTLSHVYLTTYETLREDLECLPNKNFDLCILDEVQRIKNPTTQVTKSVREIDARIRWGLSGTPLENRVEELVSILAYLKPGLLKYDDAGWPDLVMKKIKPYFLRRRKTDVLKDLPEKVKNLVWISLSPAQQVAYDLAEKEGVVALNEQGESVTIQHILALITKLKQICNVDIVSGESSKLEHLKDKLESIKEQGDKALVFSQFPEKTLRFLEANLQEHQPLMYHGGLSDGQRDDIVTKFQRDEQNRVLLMSVKAGGLGITLTRANYVYHFDQWWNPATSTQAEDRTHRIGQKKTVFVTTLMTTGTIEERVHLLLERKRALFNEVIDNLSEVNIDKVLTKDELFSLFNLTPGKKKSASGQSTNGPFSIDDLFNITPEEFEHLTAKLYTAMGYRVSATPFSRDGGVDLYATVISDSGTESLIVQCKQYPRRIVGVEHIRSLYGAVSHDPKITRGILITTGGFSKDAVEFSSGKRIELWDVNKLMGLLIKYKVPIV